MPRQSVMLRVAREVLPEHEVDLMPKGFDVVGDIAVIKVPKRLEPKRFAIAEVLLGKLPYIKTVLRQTAPVAGEFRTRSLEWLAGERRTETVYKEHGCSFKVDLGRVYFSPRLSYERTRIAKLVRPNEVIVNMFAGIGCFSIIIAKHSDASRVHSIDINPDAVRLMNENISLNRVGGIVVAIEGDSRNVIKAGLRNVADRVLMPLPEKAFGYLDAAILALKPAGGWVHFHEFTHGRAEENPIQKVVKKVSTRLRESDINLVISHSNVVRTVGPNWHQVSLDILVKKIG